MNPYGNGMWVKLLSVTIVFAFLISGAAIALSSDVSEPSEITLAQDYVPGTEWVKSGVVLDIGGTGQESHVTTPSVLKLADGTYAMWYVGSGPSGYRNIYKAVSQDGITWTKAGLALAYGEAYATVGVMYPFVRLTDDGGYDMWYAAYDGSRNTRILRATSADGVSWTKLGTQLVYGSTYDPAGLNSPRVYYDGTQWHMWYSACRWTPNRGWVCHAHRATENDVWVKDEIVLANDTALDSFSAGVQWIVPTENGYDMFYGGRGPDQYPGRILHAHSADGLTWTKTGLVIDRTLPGESYMADYPTVIFEDGKFKMWYVGYDGVNSRIYYAETASADPEPTETVDLSIASQDVSLSDSEPTVGTPVTITATVHGDPSASATSSEKSLVFSDDFGTGTLSKWIKTSWNPSGLLEVSSAVSNTTPYSLHCQSDPGTNTGPYVMKFLDSAYAHSITETMFYLPAKAQSIDKWDIIRVGSSTGTVFSTTNYEFYIALRDDDYSIDLFEYVKDASGVWSYGCLAMDVYELTPQTWNKVSLEITPTDYALRVGDTVVANGERAASTLIHHVLLGDEGGSAGCWGDSYWDDVKVWSVTESQVSEPGLDATCSVEFYLDAVDPANLIGSVDNVFVPAGGVETAELVWNPVAGEHNVIALVTNVNPGDADLSNNQASVSVTVADQESTGSVDLSLSNGDLATSTVEPRSGEPITVTATVHGDVSIQSDWEKRGVALDIGGAGESLNVVSPSVLQKEDGTYVMYYSGSELSGYNFRIFRAESTDGITWVKKGIALNYGGAYAGVTVFHPYVMIIDGIYHMWYNGINLEDGYRGRILHATSADGITFIPTGLDLNFGTSVDPAGVHCPFVMNDDSTYRMWYMGTYWTPNFNRICLAEKSSLGDAWVRKGTVLSNDGQYDSANTQRPWVLKLDDGTYEMFYSGSDSTSIGRILRATSPDGVSWSKDGIAIAPTLPQESLSVFYPCVLNDEGTYKMWYGGYSGTNQRIFYAEKGIEYEAQDATCSVSFYMDSVTEANLITTVENVAVPADGQTPVSIEWTPVAGEHDIIAVISDVNPTDIDETNNVASIPVVVVSEEVIPGEVDLSIIADDISVPENPTVGETSALSATVHNLGAGQGVWEKQGVVLSPGSSAQYPYVIKDGSIYKMWYTGYGTTYDIYYATSTDRVTWTNYGKVLTHPSGTNYAAAPSVIKETDGTYKMWYSCQNYLWKSEIYYATSADGISWTQLGKVLPIGAVGSFDSVYACQGYVFKEAGMYKIYYKAYDSSLVSRFGLATSPDGITWTKYGSVMNTPAGYAAMECPFVLPNEAGSYDMWFSTGKILKTTSIDGINWETPVVDLDVTPGTQDSRALYTQCVLRESDKSYLFYSGDSGSIAYIFMAEMTPAGLDATCTVEFYMDSVDTANLIGSVDNVFVPAGGQTPVSIEWTPVAGEHQIIAVVTDVVPQDRDSSNNMAQIPISVAESGPAEVTVQKVRLSGIEEGITHTYYEWELQITVTNVGGSAADSVMVFDVLPAELELMEMVPSTGSTESFGPLDEGTRAAPTPDTVLPQKSTHITWSVGTLEPGQSETLYMKIGTRLNPAGQQEFTSHGTYIINEGAYAKWVDSLTGTELVSEPAPAITVEISELVINVIENPHVPLPKTWFFMIMSFACFVPGFAQKRRK